MAIQKNVFFCIVLAIVVENAFEKGNPKQNDLLLNKYLNFSKNMIKKAGLITCFNMFFVDDFIF